MIASTVSITEAVWTLASIPGFWYAMRLLRRALGDLNSLRVNRINSIREYSAMVTVYTYFLFTFVEFGFIVAGCAAMLAKPANPDHSITAVQLIVTVTFLMINFVLGFGCMVIERRRNAIIEMVSKDGMRRDRRAEDNKENEQ